MKNNHRSLLLYIEHSAYLLRNRDDNSTLFKPPISKSLSKLANHNQLLIEGRFTARFMSNCVDFFEFEIKSLAKSQIKSMINNILLFAVSSVGILPNLHKYCNRFSIQYLFLRLRMR